MAITYVGAGAAQVGDISGNVTIPVPSGYSAGDLLVIVGIFNSAPTISGWTLATNLTTKVLYKFASASESSVSTNVGNNQNTAQMFAYSGVASFNSASSSDTTGTSASMNFGPITTTAANCLVIDSGTTYPTFVSIGTPSGTNSRSIIPSNGTTIGFVVADFILVTTGSSGIQSASLSSSIQWTTNAVAFAPSVAPVVVTNGNFFMMFK